MNERSTKTEAPHLREDTLTVLAQFPAQREQLIPILQSVQSRLGFLSPESLLEIARFLALPPGEVFGVATFYRQFRFTPPAKNPIKVCLGTACHVRGGNVIMEEWERRLAIKEGTLTEDREFGLERVACVGCCALAPVTVVGDAVHGNMSPSAVNGILLQWELKKNKDSQE
jgi:NADH-quinone oxidoreductase subunit E